MPPKLVPTSSPASARKKRALPSRAMIAIISADQLNSSPTAKVGTSAAATQVVAKTRYGAIRNSQDALGQHDLFAHQAQQIAVRLNQGRPCAAGVWS